MKKLKAKVIIEKKDNLLRIVKWYSESNGEPVVSSFAVSSCENKISAEKLKRTLRQLLEKVSYSNEPVTVILDSRGAAYRYLRFPTQNEIELKSMIRNQMVKIVPFSIDEMLSGYDIVKKSDGYSYVSIVSVRKKEVDSLIAAFESLEVVLEAAYINTYGIAKLVRRLDIPIEEERMLVYCDGKKTEFLVMNGAKLCFNRSVYVKNKKDFIRHIMDTQSHYVRQNDAGPLSRICILGSQENVQDIEKEIKKKIPIAVEAFDLNEIVNVSNVMGVEDFSENMTSIFSFFDLELPESLNVLPYELQEKKQFSKSLKQKGITLGMMLLALFTAVSISFVRTGKLKRVYRKVGAELHQAEQKAGELEKMKQRLEILNASKDETLFMLDFFYLVHTSLPSGVVVQTVEYEYGEQREFILTGMAAKSEQVFSYEEYMRSLGLFEPDNIKVNYVTSQNVKGRDRVVFEILFIK